jgi:hypothetical protein
MNFFTQITSKAGVGIGNGAIGYVWTYVSMYITIPVIIFECSENVLNPP